MTFAGSIGQVLEDIHQFALNPVGAGQPRLASPSR